MSVGYECVEYVRRRRVCGALSSAASAFATDVDRLCGTHVFAISQSLIHHESAHFRKRHMRVGGYG